MTRDDVRTKIFAGRKRKSKVIIIFGAKVEVRQPSVGQALSLSQTSNNADALLNFMLNYVYVPGTEDKVFEDADRESILNFPAESWMREFSDAIEELTGLDLEQAEKNSGKPQPAS
jgi:hypothetical protein